MDQDRWDQDEQLAIEQILGYLNFSSGAPDAGFQANLNGLYGRLESNPSEASQAATTADRLNRLLSDRLQELRGAKSAFADVSQAEAVLRAVFQWVLPAYRRFHSDLLFHQRAEDLFQPLFIARVCEAVLKIGGDWSDQARVEQLVLHAINDYVGHRPVAVLENGRKVEPYEHERVRPIPVYLRGVCTAVGKYHDLIKQALSILERTDSDILEEAWFDLGQLDELAIDPRAYDFDHPANGRPNYVFGQWDPHQIDRSGKFQRFVLRQITVDALVDYIDQHDASRRDEAVFEAGAVLAGVMLMAAGMSGRGVETHDSSITLGRLVRHIARYRDIFFQRLLDGIEGSLGNRLRQEARSLRQPLARARSHLNQSLARRRASQLEHVSLAKLFARMGYPDAARRQAAVVPAASARMACEIDCRLTTSHHAVDRAEFARAAEQLEIVEDWLQRAIQCGAMVDPWNILGFQGNFSLFQALEDSVRDFRVEELIDRMDRIFGAMARLGGETAAAGNTELRRDVFLRFEALADWWDQFASTEVENLPQLSGRVSYESAQRVADALAQWQQAGSAAGDIAFWRDQVERFQSARAYAPVVEALLNHGDYVSAMALLMQWLSQADQAGLDAGKISFHVLAVRWLRQIDQHTAADQAWPTICRFFDYFEANAGEYWHVPEFLFSARRASEPAELAIEETADEAEEELFQAAYEDMVYTDSTADGQQGNLLEEGDPATGFELDQEARRLSDRLTLLGAVATLWKLASRKAGAMPLPPKSSASRQRDETLERWLAHAQENQRQLLRLLGEIGSYRITLPRGSHASMVEYDRRRRVQQMLLERTIAAKVETSVAQRTILGAMDRPGEAAAHLPDWARPTVAGLRCAFRGEVEGVREKLPPLIEAIRRQPLLYVPLNHRGNPLKIAKALDVQRVLSDLLRGLPRLGLLEETCEIIDTVQAMETDHPVGPGAVTQFDRLFQAGYQALVESVVRAAEPEEKNGTSNASELSVDARLVDLIEVLTESLLKRWLRHSRLLRLSVLEPLSDELRWGRLKQFIERYGHDLFTQSFFNPGNLRAILDAGVGTYLQQLDEGSHGEQRPRLLDELDEGISREEAVESLKLVIEAVIENYACYRDYNTTTTQSDRGEMLYVFLDFMRLKASYERLSWNLRPVVQAHEILVRRGRDEAAELWRRAMAEKTAETADRYQAEYMQLVKASGMRLPTVGDRLAERFVRPLALDGARALIKPAVDEARRGQPGESFRILEQEIDDFTRTPTGAGLDVPDWLEALEDEVDQAQGAEFFPVDVARPPSALDWTPLSLKQARSQIEHISERDRKE